jgi:hypothetical protein
MKLLHRLLHLFQAEPKKLGPRDQAIKELHELLPPRLAELVAAHVVDEYHRAEPRAGTDLDGYQKLKQAEGILADFAHAFGGLAEEEPLDYADLDQYLQEARVLVRSARQEYEQLLFGGKTRARFKHEQEDQ